MAIFARSPKTRIFWKSAKGGPRESFQKSAKKVALAWKTQHHSGANGIILELEYTYSAKTEEDFRAKKEVQKRPNGQVIAIFCKVTQNPYFLKKCKGGTKIKFSKIAKK